MMLGITGKKKTEKILQANKKKTKPQPFGMKTIKKSQLINKMKPEPLIWHLINLWI